MRCILVKISSRWQRMRTLMFGKVCADACDDADSILADDGDDCLVHGAP